MVADLAGQEERLKEQTVLLYGGQQGQHVLHELGGSPIAELTTKGQLETLVHRLGGEEVQQPDLQNHVL